MSDASDKRRASHHYRCPPRSNLCGLTEQEVLAIAEHDHVPEIAAAAIGRYLLKEPNGPEKIRDMMRDDIHDALSRGDTDHASELLMILRHFVVTHPEANSKSIS